MMDIRIAALVAACALALSACGNDTPPPAEPAATPPAADTAATEPAPAAAPAETPAAGTAAPGTDATAQGNDPAVVADCATTIDSTDAMQYDADSITIPASCTQFTIHLTHSGQMPVQAMGHNIVIAAQSDMAGVLADGMGAGLDNDYVKPGDTRVVAHTELIGAGGETSVTFDVSKLQSGGPYAFFCSFPGHAALMKGSISVG
jgi:azurin